MLGGMGILIAVVVGGYLLKRESEFWKIIGALLVGWAILSLCFIIACAGLAM